MPVRQRQPNDLAACVVALAAVHAADGYPARWPDDPAAWLTPAGLLAAWVAADGDHLLGHVALCAVTDAARWPAPAGLPHVPFAEVCRLFVAPGARGRGRGARLLETATDAARAHGRLPALKVVAHDRAAIALYERAGWRRVASVAMPWEVADPDMALLHTYLAPE